MNAAEIRKRWPGYAAEADKYPVTEHETLHCPECHMVGVHEWQCSRSWSPQNAADEDAGTDAGEVEVEARKL